MNRRVLLVHGAWHGAWAWEPLVPLLEERGHRVETVELPSSRGDGDLHADAAVVRAALLGNEEPTVLVGHSYAGAVISEASVGIEHVEHLVYVCAFMLDAGASLLEAVGGEAPAWWVVDPETGLVTADDARDVMYGGLDERLAEDWARRLGRQTLSSFTQPQGGAGWREIPSTYIVTTRDRAIPREGQVAMAQQADRTLEIDTSHSPFATHPDTVADAICTEPPSRAVSAVGR